MHPVEGLALELLHARSSDPERPSDRLGRRGVVAGEAEPADDHLALPRREPAEQRADGAPVHAQGLDGIVRRPRPAARRASRAPSSPTGSSSEATGAATCRRCSTSARVMSERGASSALVGARPSLRPQLALEPLQAQQAGVGVGWQAHEPRLLGDGAHHVLADPVARRTSRTGSRAGGRTSRRRGSGRSSPPGPGRRAARRDADTAWPRRRRAAGSPRSSAPGRERRRVRCGGRARAPPRRSAAWSERHGAGTGRGRRSSDGALRLRHRRRPRRAGGRGWMPAANATAAASARVRTPSFSKMFATWNFTVCWLRRELVGDLAVAVAHGEQPQDVELAVAERPDERARGLVDLEGVLGMQAQVTPAGACPSRPPSRSGAIRPALSARRRIARSPPRARGLRIEAAAVVDDRHHSSSSSDRPGHAPASGLRVLHDVQHGRAGDPGRGVEHGVRDQVLRPSRSVHSSRMPDARARSPISRSTAAKASSTLRACRQSGRRSRRSASACEARMAAVEPAWRCPPPRHARR